MYGTPRKCWQRPVMIQRKDIDDDSFQTGNRLRSSQLVEESPQDIYLDSAAKYLPLKIEERRISRYR